MRLPHGLPSVRVSFSSILRSVRVSFRPCARVSAGWVRRVQGRSFGMSCEGCKAGDCEHVRCGYLSVCVCVCGCTASVVRGVRQAIAMRLPFCVCVCVCVCVWLHCLCCEGCKTGDSEYVRCGYRLRLQHLLLVPFTLSVCCTACVAPSVARPVEPPLHGL